MTREEQALLEARVRVEAALTLLGPVWALMEDSRLGESKLAGYTCGEHAVLVYPEAHADRSELAKCQFRVFQGDLFQRGEDEPRIETLSGVHRGTRGYMCYRECFSFFPMRKVLGTRVPMWQN